MSTASTIEREMLALINEERTSRGLNPLQLETRLNDASEDHSEWMLDTDIFSHSGQGSSSPTARMQEAGFDFSGNWRSGENIAWQSERGAPGISDDVEQLHQNLMNSPGHRANILNPDFEYIGIGIETGDMQGFDAVMVTQNFATTDGQVVLDNGAPAPQPQTPAPEEVAEPEVVEEPETGVTETEEPTQEPPETEVTETEVPEEPETGVTETEEPNPEQPETEVTETEVPEEPETGVTETEEPTPEQPETEVTETEETEAPVMACFDVDAFLAALENPENEFFVIVENFMRDEADPGMGDEAELALTLNTRNTADSGDAGTGEETDAFGWRMSDAEDVFVFNCCESDWMLDAA